MPATTLPLDAVLALVDAHLEELGSRAVTTCAEAGDLLLDLRSALVETAELEDLLAPEKPLLAAEPAREGIEPLGSRVDVRR
jgi:hypothetical protein